VVQEVPEGLFKANVVTLIDALATAVSPGRVVVVSTPDYTVTPAGRDYGNPAGRRASIVAFNGILEGLTSTRGVAYVDILDISVRAGQDSSLVARDGLHPSAAQYRLWVDRLAPVVEGLIGG
jgi:lysophospholipase L1-like esterase